MSDSDHSSAENRFTGVGTAADVAKKAGVSVMTVSRAFNNSPLVSQKTRERIFRTARELNYSPNVAGRALRKGRLEYVAFIFDKRSAFSRWPAGEILLGLNAPVIEAGYGVTVSLPVKGRKAMDVAREIVSSNRCSAVLMHYRPKNVEAMRQLAEVDVPLVLLGCNPEEAREVGPVSSVWADLDGGMREAVQHLASLGHRDIAMLSGRPKRNHALQRLEGFQRGMMDLGLTVRPEWIKECEERSEPAEGQAAMDSIFAQGEGIPTAVVCESDELAIGAIHAIHAHGLRVPDDFSVIGFDDQPFCRFLVPALTTVRLSAFEMGKEAGALAIDAIRGGTDFAKPRSVLISTELIARESCRRPRERRLESLSL